MSGLNAAVIGTGFIAAAHIEAIRRLGHNIVGVLGSSHEKSRAAADRWHIQNAYPDLTELAADTRIEVVHVTSPNDCHYEQCKTLLAAGKHVLCEKPLAMDSQQSAELVRLAAEAPVRTAVCYNVRFYPLCQELKQRIASGELGEIFHVTGSYVQDWLLWSTDFNWRLLPEKSGPLRAVADIGTHWMDLIQFITGKKIEHVCAQLGTFLKQRSRPRDASATFTSSVSDEADLVAIRTEDYGSVQFVMEGETLGHFHVSQVTAGRKNRLSFEIAGSLGSASWDSERPNELWLGFRDRPNEVLLRDPSLLRSQAARFADYPGGHNEGFPDTFKQLTRLFYHSITDPAIEQDALPSFADGHHELLLCEAIHRSHLERGWCPVVSR